MSTFEEVKAKFDRADDYTNELHDLCDTLGAPDPTAHPHVAQIAGLLFMIVKRLDRIADALETDQLKAPQLRSMK